MRSFYYLFSFLTLVTFFSCQKSADNSFNVEPENISIYEDLLIDHETIVLNIPSELSNEQVGEYLLGLSEEDFIKLLVKDSDEIEFRGCTTTYPNTLQCFTWYHDCYPLLQKYRLKTRKSCSNWQYDQLEWVKAGCCNYG